MSPVSDHVWVSHERALVLAEAYRSLSREVIALSRQLPGGAEGPRPRALACAAELQEIAEELAAGQGPVRMSQPPLREVGANTRRGLKRLAGNRGRQ